MQQGSTYRIDCGWCKGEDKQATYFGESPRTLYNRGKEHLDGRRLKSEEYVLVQHMREVHQEKKVEDHRFSMRKIKSLPRPLNRQIHM